MVDTVGIVILLLALLLMPAEHKATTLDVVNTRDGRVVSLAAERGAKGFVLRALDAPPEEAAEAIEVTQEGGTLGFRLPGAPEPMSFDLSQAQTAIQGWDGAKPLSLEVDGNTFVLTRKGKLTYLVVKGREQLLTKRD